MKNITFSPDQEKIFVEAVSLYGEDSQLTQTNEECTELSLAILKYQRELKKKPIDVEQIQRRRKELLSEISDVIVMTQQCVLIFGPEEIQQEINYKLRRQRKRIDKRINQMTESSIMTGFPKIA